MFRFAPLIAALLLTLPAHAADKRVWRIDSLIASRKKGVITVEAKGAVQSGGWTKARLKLVHSDVHGASFEFIAVPPPPGMTVIDAVVPMKATAQLRIRTVSVHAVAEENEMTTQVLR